MQKIVLFEINEIPFRVIDHYCKARPNSAFARILSHSEQYETTTEDTLALDPWISWPTFHRGVPDNKHQILHLGQVLRDVDSAYPPIWRILHNHGISVGVFGSLHSSSLPTDAETYAFYVSDCFDNHVFTKPRSLEAFQELNLRMTRASARNVSRNLPLGKALKFAMTAPGNGLTASTFARVAAQLAGEMTNERLKIRRRNIQPLIAFDLFMKQLALKNPQFATFYTNHVAAAMHRYWGATFPQDFEQGSLQPDWIGRYRQELDAAMDTLDLMLGKLTRFADSNPAYTVVLASSMGQSAIPASHTYEFLTITNMKKFMGMMGVPDDAWEVRPAMVPCHCVTVDSRHRDPLIQKLRSLTICGRSMIEDPRPVGPVSFDEREHGFFQLFVAFDQFDRDAEAVLDGRRLSLAEAGLGAMAHEDGVNCTAQHVPQGSLVVYRPDASPLARKLRQHVSTLDFVPSVLKAFGLAKPSYMTGRATINLS